MAISAAEVKKLRDMTGAGMMDCKRALEEANGNYDEAVTIIRKKGQLVAAKRADREASEGCVITRLSADKTFGVIVTLSCETDFVAKGADFVKFTEDIADAAIAANARTLEEVRNLKVNGITVAEGVNEKVAVIGEKIDLTFFDRVDAAEVIAYPHPGNKVACILGFNKAVDATLGRNVALQVAAMAPVAVDKDDVPQDVVAKEMEIALDQVKSDPKLAGKPEAMLQNIAQGKLQKFFKEKTLMQQEYIDDNKKTVAQYIAEHDKELKVTRFVRVSLTV